MPLFGENDVDRVGHSGDEGAQKGARRPRVGMAAQLHFTNRASYDEH